MQLVVGTLAKMFFVAVGGRLERSYLDTEVQGARFRDGTVGWFAYQSSVLSPTRE
jgi:hypothetical protein